MRTFSLFLGYPSDGIVQVEEEEEADIESDRNTYTIEDDYSRHRRPQRRQNGTSEVDIELVLPMSVC